jgi:predicted nucleotidyltransferase
VAGIRPAALDRYLGALVERLGAALGADLVAVYTIGGVAFDEFVEGRSDVDVMVLVREPLTVEGRAEVVRACSLEAPTPARLLELVVYTLAQVARPGRGQRFELNLNCGGGVRHVGTDPEAEPSHWFVLDLALAREHAIALRGPPASTFVGPVADDVALEALARCVAWYARNEGGLPVVFAACRALRYAEDGVWSGKDSAVAWAVDSVGSEPLR